MTEDVLTQDEMEAIARQVILRWLDDPLNANAFAGLSAGERAKVLLTIARVAEDMAAEQLIEALPYGHLVRNRRRR